VNIAMVAAYDKLLNATQIAFQEQIVHGQLADVLKLSDGVNVNVTISPKGRRRLLDDSYVYDVAAAISGLSKDSAVDVIDSDPEAISKAVAVATGADVQPPVFVLMDSTGVVVETLPTSAPNNLATPTATLSISLSIRLGVYMSTFISLGVSNILLL